MAKLELRVDAAANSVAMASLCARYCLLRPPIPCHKIPRSSLHSRAELKVPLLATRDGASLGRNLPCRTGAGSARRGLSLRASVKPEAETEEEAETSVPAVKVDFEKDISKVSSWFAILSCQCALACQFLNVWDGGVLPLRFLGSSVSLLKVYT